MKLEICVFIKAHTSAWLSQVRSLWADIDGMLATIKEEQHAMESVLKGDVDQYILDGTDRGLKIPRCLLERIEELPNQVKRKMMDRVVLLPQTC